MANPTVYEFNPNLVPNAAANMGEAIPWDPNATAVSGANANVSISFTPTDPDKFVEISQIDASYSAAPTSAGGITITDNGVTVHQSDAKLTGNQVYQILQPRTSQLKGKTVTVTLLAGGVGITGKLNVHAWARI